MRATVKDHLLNVRRGKPSVNAPIVRVLSPGNEIETAKQLFKGDSFEGVDTWLKDDADNYYWSGGVNYAEEIEHILDTSQPLLTSQKKFEWFEKLHIDKIWSTYHERGENVTIAVLDTGYNTTIPDVADSVVDSNVIIDTAAYPGIELIQEDQSNTGHGTRCLSLIGSRNNSQYLTGIAPRCKILSAKISINREVRNFDFLLQGISWAIQKGADVISVSYAVELNDQDRISLEKKYANLIKGSNVLIFASSGNAGSTPVKAERYPASFTNCVSVGATDMNGNFSDITIQSSKTTIHAPGINIESLGKSIDPDPQSGTSFSTPIVAGIASLAISHLKKRDGTWNAGNLLSKIYASGDAIPGTDSKKIINGLELFKLL